MWKKCGCFTEKNVLGKFDGQPLVPGFEKNQLYPSSLFIQSYIEQFKS